MRRTLPAMILMTLLAVLMWGCEHDTTNGPGEPTDPGGGGVVTDKTCLGCHSDQAELVLALGEESGSKVPVPNKGDG